MDVLLILILYILVATLAAWLAYWGASYAHMPDPPRVIIAGILFVIVLLFGLSRTGLLVL